MKNREKEDKKEKEGSKEKPYQKPKLKKFELAKKIGSTTI